MICENLGKTKIIVLCIVAMLTISGQIVAQDATTIYKGRIVLPDSFNFAVGFKSTDKPCYVALRHDEGNLWVKSNFWAGEKLADGNALRGEDFYLGKLDDNGAFVLQLRRDKPVTLTQTTYDARDRLNYAGRGDGNFLRECHLGIDNRLF